MFLFPTEAEARTGTKRESRRTDRYRFEPGAQRFPEEFWRIPDEAICSMHPPIAGPA
jgi:hypothetical protein